MVDLIQAAATAQRLEVVFSHQPQTVMSKRSRQRFLDTQGC
jgi:hypothetical protein